MDLSVDFDATGLHSGYFDADMLIESNDPDESTVTVPVQLHVIGAPDIAVSPDSVDFGVVFVGGVEESGVTVTNLGTDTLYVTDISSDHPDFVPDTTTLILPPAGIQTVTTSFSPSAPVMITGTLTISSNDPDEPVVLVMLRGEGLLPPECEVEPDSITAVAMSGMVVTEDLRITNTGGSDLIYHVGAIQSMAVTSGDFLHVPKDEDDPRPGHPAADGRGGPDAFGYRWIDSNEPGGPVFDWVDITTVGTLIPMDGDDENTGPWPIGFDFPFYGNSFNSFRICTNGFVSFTCSDYYYSNQPLPNGYYRVCENLLAVWWEDQHFRYVDRAYYYSDGSRLIIEFVDVERYSSYPEGGVYTYEIILYPNGRIIYQYLSMTGYVESATIGIQNATKDDGLEIVYNAAYMHDNLAIEITAAPEWLTVSPISGVIPAGGYEDLTVTCDATALEDGAYDGMISIVSNDLTDPVIDCPVIFIVDWEPATFADVDPNTLNLSSNGNWVKMEMGMPLGYDPNLFLPETAFFTAGGDSVSPPEKLEILGPDEGGIYTLMMRFNRGDVEDVLPEGDSVEVLAAGEIEDITYLVGWDTIRCIRPKITHPNGGEIFYHYENIIISWEAPASYDVDTYAVYFSADAGESWTEVTSAITTQRVIVGVPMVETEHALFRVYAFQGDEVIGYDTSDDIFTINSPQGAGIEDKPKPTVFALKQNTPNPFTGKTMLRFDLPKDVDVRLSIFDVRGRLVKVVVNQTLTSGRYSMSWDGKGVHGNRVAPGVYYCTIKAGEWTDTIEVVIAR
jgi:hypothetical protein